MFRGHIAKIGIFNQSLTNNLTDCSAYRTILTLALIRRRCRTARYGMGNLMGNVVFAEIKFDFARYFSVYGTD
ncbi:hypothetical protein NM96060_2235, partial [Neisseria meningitidis 96060]